jgi:hypothetical protein
MNTKFSDLVQYFSMIAAQHVAIGHSYAENHFYRFEIEEVLTGLKHINYPALVLEGYRCTFTDQLSDNILKQRTGAFILLDHLADLGDYDAMHRIWDNLETIGDDIITRIRNDKHNPESRVIRDIDIGTVEYTLIANEQDKNFGIRITFVITTPFSGEPDPGRWNLNTIIPC